MLKIQGKKWLIRRLEEVKMLDIYRIDRTIGSIAKQFRIDPEEIVKLNNNENFFMPKKRLFELMKEVAEEYDPRIYPQEEEHKIKEKLGEYIKVPKGFVIVGNGEDELIGRIVQFFLGKKDRALSITPSFPIYKHCVNRLGARYLEVPLKKDFTLNTKQILFMTTPQTRLLYLCSPNNPTGNQFEIDEIKLLLEEFPGIVIVDEAYAEYADFSAVPLLEKFDNLIILRTFSKAFGLAGLRLGYGIANLEVATVISEKTPLPYPMSSFTLRMGVKVLENIHLVKKAIRQLKVEREKFTKKLNEVNGVKAFTSQTNFILFQTSKQLEEIYQGLLSQGILIKKLGKILHLDNCFRTTVGLPQMNNRLLNALVKLCKKYVSLEV